MEWKSKVAVVTGAGSGIGRALAQRLAQKGCQLALVDVNADALAETAKSLSVPALTQALDVADRTAVYAFADRVQCELGTPYLVINNAGVAVSQTVADLQYDDFDWLMGINFWGMVYGTKAYLPNMLQKNEGIIINVSSLFGLIAPPTQSAYCAAKFGIRGFTESLRHELESAGSGVRALCVHPGGIKTNIVASSRHYVSMDGSRDSQMAVRNFNKIAKTTPERAADVIVKGIESGSRRILIGDDAKLFDWIQRWMPVNYGRVFLWIAARLGKK